ncbi:hypothetical protein Pcinc_027416 [Petrolisthes cinctipes]|uniref:VWFA domain-containing protein n=1 Tax=Petrolisthes cinctipes TaxID=88211 RepID=A0AAE1F4E9_PETCI|nr:hypothetical protein Pcinc_027416 [Petrolisthes cinctipes]
MRASICVWAVAWALCLVVGVVEGRARLVENGFEGVVVALSQELEEEQAPAIIETLRDILDETSRRLYRATHKRAYLRQINILVPKSWTSINVSDNALNEDFQDSDIRVDIMNGVYGHQPYTLQTAGCGQPGLYIHLTPQYLLDDREAGWYGPRGKALLLEWAKFRWGVFDELGYPGDPSFPLFYIKEYPGRGGSNILPTYCADVQVEGRQIDRRGRSACGLTYTGEPDPNCRFLPYKYQRAASSLMSYPFIFTDSVVDFCDSASSQRPHNSVAPTKQNLFCGGRSVWEIMMQHEDFDDGRNPPTSDYQSPTIQVVQHTDANYALVLDYSGSMNDNYRVHKLRKTARRWLLQEVATGSNVAIVKFSKHAHLVHKLTRIEDMESRQELANSIDAKADGGTSIGAGLYLVVKKILVGKKNPVILLITDGEENENPRIDDILENVIQSGVRVITVAFGAEADPKLEMVAHNTGGKTFTVNDLDEGHMLEDAFDGALTYQPPPPRKDTLVTIHEEVYRGTERTAESEFSVDFTVGRNLLLRLHTDDRHHVTTPPFLVSPSGEVVQGAEFDYSSFTWAMRVPLAEEGRWRWQVGLSGSSENFVRVKVTSQPRNPDIHPITTRAWVSSGARDINAKVDKVVIYAEVKQGNSPVVDADVRALVTPPMESEPAQVYILRDNGQGADILAGDGIYSRYMTRYPTTGRYSVKAQVTDGGRAVINKGFLTSVERKKRSVTNTYDEAFYKERPDICCGSFIPIHHETSQDTGLFSRVSGGGSFKVTDVAGPDIDSQPPGEVRDLQILLLLDEDDEDELSQQEQQVILIWTAPGDDLDLGTVSKYVLRKTSNRSELAEETFDQGGAETVVEMEEFPGVYVEAGETVNITVPVFIDHGETLYWALRAIDDVGGRSPVSNIAVMSREARHITLTSYVPIWGIIAVIAVVVLIIVCVSIAMATRRYGKYECVEPKTKYDPKT